MKTPNPIQLTIAIGAALALAQPLAAQSPLTLGKAFERADQNAFANRISAAEADVAGARRTEAMRGILPSFRAEGGFVRTTDPIGVFGATLRQRRIAAANFDPARLNYPDAVTNYGSAVVLEQPIFNADAYLGRTAAAHGAQSVSAMSTWVLTDTRLDVVRAYFGTVLAVEKVAALEQAGRAGLSHAVQAQKLVDAGLATRSDALLAQVRADEIAVQALEARGDVDIARRQLAVLLGAPEDTAFTLPDNLPTTNQMQDLLSADITQAAEQRSDIAAARFGLSAATADARRALSVFLPRLNGFARYDWNSSGSMYGGPSAWSVGVMATWTPFAGAAELADRDATAARKRMAATQLEAVRAQAALDVAQAENKRVVSVKRLEVALRAAAQSREAHRIVAAKYAGGLATITELLDAAAIETQSTLALAAARYNAVVVEAERRRAAGSNLSELPSQLIIETAKNDQ